MERLHQLKSALRFLFRRASLERQMTEELSAYAAHRAADLERAGVPDESARQRARLELGSLDYVKDEMRDSVPAGTLIDSIYKDLVYAGRTMRRSPAFTASAVLTLALAIGGISAIFSVVKAVLLDPPPYAEPGRLVLVWNEFRTSGLTRAPGAGFVLQQIRERSRSFASVGGIWASNGTFLGEREPEQVKLGNVTGNFFPILGAKPLLGRTILPDDEGDGKQPVVLLSYGLWQRRFGGNESVVGQTVRMDGASPVVVGVMRPEFRMAFPPDAQVPAEIQAWAPFPWNVYAGPRTLYFLRFIARLNPGVTLPQAGEEAASIAAQLRTEFTEYANNQLGLNVVPIHRDAVREIRPALLALLSGVALVLLIACVNVANLLLARAGARQKEMAVRAALGASRGRILRQLLLESFVLAAGGAAAGLLVGAWSLERLVALAPPGLLPPGSTEMDWSVLGFTILVALGCGILFGLAPALDGARVSLIRALQHTGRTAATVMRRRSRAALIVSEVALGFVLVIGAGLMVRTFFEVSRVNPGFRAQGLLTLEMDLPGRRYPGDLERTNLVRAVEDKLRAWPGVERVGGISHLPLDDYANWYSSFAAEGGPAEKKGALMADHRSATPEYFKAVGAELVQGRFFDAMDEQSRRHVVVVDERVAAEAFPGQNPIGKKLQFEKLTQGEFGRGSADVVGVIRHIQHHALTRQVRGQIYIPFSQSVRWHISFVVRTGGDPSALAGPARAVIASIDKDLAIAKLRPMSFYLDRAMAATRFTMVLAAIFGGLALLLAAIGIYGVVGYSVAQRTAEFGVRIALGAQRGDIIRHVMREGMALAIAGITIGCAGALGLSRFLATLLFGVSPVDPVTFGSAALVLAFSALAACWLPAQRAAAREPIAVLRVD
jgi:putative ABC transport system permease protein